MSYQFELTASDGSEWSGIGAAFATAGQQYSNVAIVTPTPIMGLGRR